MTSNSASDACSRNRYRAVDNEAIPVAIQRLDEGQKPASGNLVNISASSARVVSNMPFKFGEKLVLHLAPKATGLDIRIGCDVQWIREGDLEDEWIVRCLFGSQLETALLEDYVDNGLLERRETDRHEVSLPASIKFEGESEWTTISLYNVGTGGFCFLSPTTGMIGSRVRLALDADPDDEIEGRIMWQSENDGEHRIGCQWMNRKGTVFARQLSETTTASPEPSPRPAKRRVMGGVILAVLAFSLGVFLAESVSALSEYLPAGVNLDALAR